MKVWRIIEYIFLALIIGLIVYFVNLKTTLELILTLDITFYLLALLLNLILIFSMVMSLKFIFNTIKKISINNWLTVYIPGFAVGLFLPGRAGDMTMIAIAKNKGYEIGQSTSLIIIDKITTLLIYIPIAIIGFFTILHTKELGWSIFFSFLLFMGLLFLFTKFGRNIIKKLLGKYAEKFSGFYKTFTSLLQNQKKAILLNILMTLLRPILNGLIMIIIFLSLGYNLSFFSAVIITTITLIVSIIPITPNGFGIREGLGIILLSEAGVPSETTIAMYLILLSISCICTIILYLYYLIISNYFKTLT